MILIVSSIFDFVLPNFVVSTIAWIIPIIFFLRSIGDFRYVGLTKKVKGTVFARLDTLYFAPLCLLIAWLGVVVQVVK